MVKIKCINNISHAFDNTLSQDPQRPRAPRVRAPQVRAPQVQAPRVRAPRVRAPLAPRAHDASLISIAKLSFIPRNLLLENELEISIILHFSSYSSSF